MPPPAQSAITASSSQPSSWPAGARAASDALSVVSAGWESVQATTTAAPAAPIASTDAERSRSGVTTNQNTRPTIRASRAPREYARITVNSSRQMAGPASAT
jgi:hypothetical protein